MIAIRTDATPRLAPLAGLLVATVALGATAMSCGDDSAAGGAGASASSSASSSTSSATSGGPLPTGPVFLILFENKNWADIKASASSPTFQSAMAQGARAEQYMNPPALHPSEPNYIWLEAGDSLAILTDADPATNHKATTEHLVTQLETAGHTWKSYQEDIPGTDCPLTKVNKYAPKHNAFVFFDDVTDTNDPAAPRCIAHVRPFTELAADLAADTVADYNFITPNLCNDMHDVCPPQNDSIKQGDDWLAALLPQIQSSAAYERGGVIFITFDEGLLSDGPIGFIALSKTAKPGYSNDVPYTHSSTLKTIEEMFDVPLLRHAADPDVNDLSDLFTAP